MRRLGALVAGLALLIGIFTVLRFTPEDHELNEPISTSGELGDTVDTAGFTITVHQVQVTRTLTVQDDFEPPPPQRTEGVWVLVTATVVGEWKPTSFNNAWLETPDGYEYEHSDRADSLFTLTGDYDAAPGIGRRGQIVFEIPPDRLPGAVLRIGRSAVEDSRLGPEALVDLMIDEDKAQRLLDNAPKQLTLKPVEFV